MPVHTTRSAYVVATSAGSESVPCLFKCLLVELTGRACGGQNASCAREELVAVEDACRHPTPITVSILREDVSSRLQQKEKHRPDTITPAGPTSTSASALAAAFHRTRTTYFRRPEIRENDASN